MIERGGWYFLFYSANGYDSVNTDGTCNYAVGVARSRSPKGPFVKYPLPVMHSVAPDAFTGPGHCSVITYPNNQGTSSFSVW